ncbi:MAG: FAD:protein FMN transferase [Gammaproteobacteria bacterium]|nr:FAD:protein FMN transferase [Gammaproteobacteria bacterium]
MSPDLRAVVACAALALLAGCQPARHVEQFRGPTMGTSYHLEVAARDATPFPRAQLEAGIAVILATLDRGLSTYRPDSDLSRFNAARTREWVPVSADVAVVVAEAQRISALTNGAFDVTVGPLVNAWGFGPVKKPQTVPSEAEIAQAKQDIGFRKLHVRLEPPALRKDDPAMVIDLNAIGPGLAIDQLAAFLEREGHGDYLVELGGEVLSKGRKPDGSAWRIGIENPLATPRALVATAEVEGQALSTAGDYRAYFDAGGRRYSHILDPRTGRPITHALTSVSVVAPSALSANGWDTALMVMGPDEARALAEQQKLAALFVIRTPAGFRTESTSGFRAYAAGLVH